jgi:hypothetical protein
MIFLLASGIAIYFFVVCGGGFRVAAAAKVNVRS